MVIDIDKLKGLLIGRQIFSEYPFKPFELNDINLTPVDPEEPSKYRIRTLSDKKVEYKIEVPVYIISKNGSMKHFVNFPTKQILQKQLDRSIEKINQVNRGIISEDSDLYVVKNKTTIFITKFISQKYKIKMKYITHSTCMENIDGIWYKRINNIRIEMPTQYMRAWRLNKLLNKTK